MTRTITYPSQIVTAGNEVLINVVVTDAWVSRGLSTNGALYLSTFHNVGDTIAFTWNDNSVTFTCVSDYSGVIGTYPVRTTKTIQEWGEIVFGILASHYLLADDFIISGEAGTSNYIVRFEPIEKYSWNNLNITCAASTVIDSNYTSDELYENYKMQLQLMHKSKDGNITTIEKYRSAVFISFAYNDLDASLIYDISRLLYDDITGHFTFPETGFYYLQANVVKQLYFFLSFIADNIETVSLPIEHYCYVLPGRLSKSKIKAINTAGTSLYAQLTSGKKFLSDAPLTKITDIYAPEKLYFFFQAYSHPAKLRTREDYDDGTYELRDLCEFTYEEYTLYEFSVGFQSIKKADYAGKRPISYTIYLVKTTGQMISEVRTFILDYTYRRTARYFLFKNSWGVYELLRTTGDAKKTNSIEKEFYSRPVQGMTDADQLRKPANIKQSFSAEINTGYLEAPWNIYYATELLASEDVYWLKNDRAYAIQIESSDPDFSGSDLINQHNFDFKVTADDIDDSFYTDYGPESELPVLGDFSGDFNDDYNV